MSNRCIYGTSFYGNEVSDYGKQCGYVDYATLAKSFNHILNNDITQVVDDIELIHGSELDDEGEFIEFYQYYIIDEEGRGILEDFTDETIWYIPKLNIYLWGVTHYGTSWDYVLTDIKINQGEKAWKKDSE